ncbi:MAG: tRNA 2-thiocytidine(32) synthetase TtcA [Syntrophobacterales bacterium]|nr:tRNA 2-thiocytidine(32) synthetase TtcA [Syntrophobacterales bacterium]
MGTYLEREIRHLFGKAVHGYNLIEDGDKIAVAFSGGKDSVLLLHLLRERLSYIPIRYELFAIYVDLGFDPKMAEMVDSFLKSTNVSYEIIMTDIGIRAHSRENRENPCFLCSRLRRKAIFKAVWDRGYRKIAFGHNQDDLIETFFLNVCYSGQIATMLPKQEFFRGELTVIRPLSLMPASKIKKFVKEKGLSFMENPCPSAGAGKRALIKELLSKLYKTNSKIRGNIFRAMSNINLEYLLPSLNGGAIDARTDKQ